MEYNINAIDLVIGHLTCLDLNGKRKKIKWLWRTTLKVEFEGWEKKDFDGCGDNSQGWLIEYACMDEWSLGSFFYLIRECVRSVDVNLMGS